MLKLFDKNHSAIGHIVKYKECKIESDVSTGDKTLSFTYLAKHHKLENETYIQTKEDEYVIKEVQEDTYGFPQIVAVLNMEELQGKIWQTFSVKDSTIEEAARPALAGTGWTIGYCDVTKRRNAGMIQVNSVGVIQNLCKAFMCEPAFDTKKKTVSFYARRGEDKGTYFLSGLNLKKLQKKSSSYDYYTRLIPIGANGLTIESVNDGKNYLENHQYSDKVLTYLWKEESYTNPQALKEDAELWLASHSRPEKSFQAEVRNLAAQKPEYAILSYGLGDTVKLIDSETDTYEEQRIVKMVQYPDDPEKDTCEIANTVLTFEEMQQKYQEAAEIINYTIAGDGRYTGTINVSDILNFEQGIAGSSTIAGINGDMADMQGEVAQIKIAVGQITANYLTAEEADIRYATVENLNAMNEIVHSIQGDYADFKSLVTDEFASHTALIDKIYNEELVTARGWMLEGAIGNAQISDVSANKLDAGTINTAVVTIAGTDGRLQLSDNTIQISDKNHVRVQAGKDASGDYSLSVWDASGRLIWDALGATEDTIQRKIIRDRMVADDAAIQALKIDFQSFDQALTDQGVTISGTVVQVGEKTLNVALTEQTQLISDQGETLTDHTAKITANENAIKLKVDTQTYQADKSGMESALSKAMSDISVLQGQISLKVEQTDIENIMDGYSTVSQVNALIEIEAAKIASAVSRIDDNEEKISALQQTEDKINWIVQSGSSATDFTLTDRTAKLITESLTIQDSTGTATVISGGKMDIDKIFANHIFAKGSIVVQDLSNKESHEKEFLDGLNEVFRNEDVIYLEDGYKKVPLSNGNYMQLTTSRITLYSATGNSKIMEMILPFPGDDGVGIGGVNIKDNGEDHSYAIASFRSSYNMEMINGTPAIVRGKGASGFNMAYNGAIVAKDVTIKDSLKMYADDALPIRVIDVKYNGDGKIHEINIGTEIAKSYHINIGGTVHVIRDVDVLEDGNMIECLLTKIYKPELELGALVTGALEFLNNKCIAGIRPEYGLTEALIPCDANGNTVLGSGSFKDKTGGTYVQGYDIVFDISNVPTGGASRYRPYYRKGDSITINLNTDGFVTSGGKEIYFTIPLSRPVMGSPTVTLTSVKGFALRQAGKYTNGSGISTWTTPDKYSARIETQGATGIAVGVTFSNTTNIINNDVIGVNWNGRITFS